MCSMMHQQRRNRMSEEEIHSHIEKTVITRWEPADYKRLLAAAEDAGVTPSVFIENTIVNKINEGRSK
jgi:hypothetical protein